MLISIEAITNALKPHLSETSVCRVIDESSQHRGHAGYSPEIGVTHIAVEIAWHGFAGLTLLERQRLANAWLDGFFKQGLHAVRYSLSVPDGA